jgi:aryl-alcohol dehydrogenase-like predicted oxidoreductase
MQRASGSSFVKQSVKQQFREQSVVKRGREHSVVNQIVIPQTTLRVSRLSFGTARLHHLATRRSRQRLLGHASASGFSHFDTAPLYGFGLAEEELGVFLASQSRALTVATKIGLYPPLGSRPRLAWVWGHKALGRVLPQLSRPAVSWSLAVAERSLHRSLRRLRRDHVDILFLHEPDPGLLQADEVLRWLERQKQLGKVRHHGAAGDAAGFARWIVAGHPLCQVLQLRDSLDRREADVALSAARSLQFTFGYLSALASASSPPARAMSTREAIQAALRRSQHGSVLVSSCAPDHVGELSQAAREASACT